LTYRKPWLIRFFPVLLILIFFAGLFMIAGSIVSKPHPNYGTLLPFVLIFGGPSLFLWRLSGPQDICFDLHEKTYRYVAGWPFFAKTRIGPISELQGVYIRETQSYGFFVGVTVFSPKLNRRGRGGGVTLETFTNRTKAEQFAAQLMSDLELNQVMPPHHLRPLT
jgi:membrane protease YdiL (CAAX protease family)